MKKLILLLTTLFSITAMADNTSDVKEIQQIIQTYAKSIDNLDLNLAEKIWLTDDKTTFIHPRGNEYGWSQIKENFYQNTMGLFNKRELKVKETDIQVRGNMAIAVFYWDFHANFKADNSPLFTQGRESQVYEKTPKGWKIVHVHYSNMPITGDKVGF